MFCKSETGDMKGYALTGLPFSCYEWRSVNPNQGLPMLQAILPLTFVSGAIGEDLRVC